MADEASTSSCQQGSHFKTSTRLLSEKRADASEDTQVSIIVVIQLSNSLNKCLSMNLKICLL